MDCRPPPVRLEDLAQSTPKAKSLPDRDASAASGRLLLTPASGSRAPKRKGVSQETPTRISKRIRKLAPDSDPILLPSHPSHPTTPQFTPEPSRFRPTSPGSKPPRRLRSVLSPSTSHMQPSSPGSPRSKADRLLAAGDAAAARRERDPSGPESQTHSRKSSKTPTKKSADNTPRSSRSPRTKKHQRSPSEDEDLQWASNLSASFAPTAGAQADPGSDANDDRGPSQKDPEPARPELSHPARRLAAALADSGFDESQLSAILEGSGLVGRLEFSNPLAGRRGGQMNSELASMLEVLKRRPNPTMIIGTLQELAEMLSMATEETFGGYGVTGRMSGFQTEAFVKAFLDILQNPIIIDEDLMDFGGAEIGLQLDFGAGNSVPDLILLTCRCLSNLIEALPSSTIHILHHGGVKILVSKLMEVEFIDLAEQVLSVLEKVSVDYPSPIIQANGLCAVLQYIDFFNIHVQRTAVTIAANACRGLSSTTRPRLLPSDASREPSTPDQIYSMIRDVMPIVERLLAYSDHKLVEQVAKMLGRIVDWCWRQGDKLEGLVSSTLLKVLVDLVISMAASEHSNSTVITQLLKIMSTIAKGSPRLGMELLSTHPAVPMIEILLVGDGTRANGVPIQESEKLASNVMKTVIGRPVEQLLQLLVLASDLLPNLPSDGLFQMSASARSEGEAEESALLPILADSSTPKRLVGAASIGADQQRRLLLQEQPLVLEPYLSGLVPVLMEVFGATMNAGLRRHAVECIVKSVWFTNPARLGALLIKIPGFGKFVSELIGLKEHAFPDLDPDLDLPQSDIAGASSKERRDALLLVVSGVQIMEIVSLRGAKSFEALFIREGAVIEIEKLLSLARTARDRAHKLTVRTGDDHPSRTTSLPSVGLFTRTNPSFAQRAHNAPEATTTAGSFGGLDIPGRSSGPSNPTSPRSQLRGRDKGKGRLTSDGSQGSLGPDDKKSCGAAEGGAPRDPEYSASSMLATMKGFLERLGRDSSVSSGVLQASRPEPTEVPLFKREAVASFSGERYTELDTWGWIIERCQGLIKAQIKDRPHDVANGGSNSVLAQVRAIAEILSGSARISSDKSPATLEGYLQTLCSLAQLIVGGGPSSEGIVGLTAFEILESGVLDALSNFMTCPGPGDLIPASLPDASLAYSVPLRERFRGFLHVFMNGPAPGRVLDNYHVPQSFALLVKRLQETLGRTEKFELALAFPTGNGVPSSSSFGEGFLGFSAFLRDMESVQQHQSGSNPGAQLNRQIRIRLSPKEDHPRSKDLASIVVSVHAVATFRTIEEYLLTRVLVQEDSMDLGVVGSRLARRLQDAAGLPRQLSGQPSINPSAKAGTAAPERVSGALETTSAKTKGLLQTEMASEEDSEMDQSFREYAERMLIDGEDEDDEDEDENGFGDDDDDEEEEEDEVDASGLFGREELRVSSIILGGRQRSPGKSTSDASNQPGFESAASSQEDPDRRDSVLDSAVTMVGASQSPTSAATCEQAGLIASDKQPIMAREEKPSIVSTSATSDSRYSSLSVSVSPPKGKSGPEPRAPATSSTVVQKPGLEFSLGEQVLSNDSTVFGALYSYESKRRSGDGVPATPINVWSQTYTIEYTRVSRGEPARPSISHGVNPASPPQLAKMESQMSIKLPFHTEVPESIAALDIPSRILKLMRILHGLNTRWEEVYESAALQGRAGGVPAVESAEDAEAMAIHTLPASAFISNKLAAKVNRQLDEPLIVASKVLPSWCESMVRDFGFLFPFKTRLVFLQSTSFGHPRCLSRWQPSQGSAASAGLGSRAGHSEAPAFGRVPKQKVRLARVRLVESMMKVMELYGTDQSLLEIEFFDEVGTGLGPTIEFYTLTSRELQRLGGVAVADPMRSSSSGRGQVGVLLKPWRNSNVVADQANGSVSEFVDTKLGLFPAPIDYNAVSTRESEALLTLFRHLGTFVAKALLDNRMIDLPLSPIFLEMAVGEEEDEESASERAFGHKGRVGAELHLVKHVDTALYASLLDLRKYAEARKRIQLRSDVSDEQKRTMISQARVREALLSDLGLDFTLPGYPEIELCPSGSAVAVDMENIDDYIEQVVEYTAGKGVRQQIEAFRQGFVKVFPITDLRAFTVQELGLLIGGAENEDWSYDAIYDALKADHGYSKESKTIAHLCQIMSEYSLAERREFMQFVTGSPKLPVGGFKALSPPLTVVRKTVEEHDRQPDDYLPSVMTCVNYLKVPDYTSKSVMKSRFEVAVKEGQGCFHLS